MIFFQISREMMSKIPILRKLQQMERRAGKDVTLQSEEKPIQSNLTSSSTRLDHPSHTPPMISDPGAADQKDITSVYIGNIPPTTRVSELKSILRERGFPPLRLTWQGAQHRAFLDYSDPCQAQLVLSSLEGLSIGEQVLQVELSRTQRNRVNGHQVYGDKKKRDYSTHGSDSTGK